MAQAKRKNTTKPSRRPLTGAEIYKQALPRMEYIIDTLATYVVADGWHESWESGPMPKRAADVMAYVRGRAAGKRENAAQEAEVNAFISDCGQSWDWIFGGDVRGMICKAAGNSPPSAGLAKPSGGGEKAQEISSGLADMETLFLQVRNFARAARMMGSCDDMPKEAGAALDTIADHIATMLAELDEERERLWRLSRALAGSAASP
jgi:hypothetical protein